jgi:hypothetical protein
MMDQPAAPGSIGPVPIVCGFRAAYQAAQVLASGYGHQRHTLALGDKGEHLARMSLPRGSNRLRDRDLKLAEKRCHVCFGDEIRYRAALGKKPAEATSTWNRDDAFTTVPGCGGYRRRCERFPAGRKTTWEKSG